MDKKNQLCKEFNVEIKCEHPDCSGCQNMFNAGRNNLRANVLGEIKKRRSERDDFEDQLLDELKGVVEVL